MRDSGGQNKLWVLQAMTDNDSLSYLEAYFKKYWILLGQSVKQKKLSLPVMLLEYKKCICTRAWRSSVGKEPTRENNWMRGKHN